MADHAWCRAPAHDAAVRAAEDGRDRPLPTLGEAIASVTETMSENGTGEEMQQGLRTERVVLEITHDLDDAGPASGWEWKDICQDWIGSPVDSVRVVTDEEPTSVWIDCWKKRHRDCVELLKEADADMARLAEERDTLKARVAELEAAQLSRAGQIGPPGSQTERKCTERDNLAASGGGEEAR